MPPQIEIPPLDNESRQAYAARVAYVTMGEQRSQDAVSQQLAKSRQLISRWSARFDWMEHARRYDEVLAGLAAQQAAARYLADLKEHQQRYSAVGKNLYAVAMAMLADLHKQRASIKPNANTLAVVSRALTTAADLEAHALGIAQLLGTLTPDDHV